MKPPTAWEIQMKAIYLQQNLFSRIVIVASLAVGLSACQSSGKPPRVPPIAPEKRIVLQEGGPHQGQYDTGELTVDYLYLLKPDLTGEILINGQIHSVRFETRKANAYVNFLDDNGTVLQRRILVATRKRSTIIPSTNQFDNTMPLPPGTTGMMFSSRLQVDRGRR